MGFCCLCVFSSLLPISDSDGNKWHVLAVVPGMGVSVGPDTIVDTNLPIESEG